MIELGKKYQTRDGRAVRILCTDLKGCGCATVIGLVTQPSGTEYVETWMADGGILPGASPECIRCSPLVPVPTKHEGWTIMPNYELRDSERRSHGDAIVQLRGCNGPKECTIVHVTWED